MIFFFQLLLELIARTVEDDSQTIKFRKKERKREKKMNFEIKWKKSEKITGFKSFNNNNNNQEWELGGGGGLS